MEKLKKRAYQLAVLFVIGGLFAHVATSASAASHDEKWMEKSSLSQLGAYKMLPGTTPDKSVTYRMDKDTYEALTPDGIVARELSDGNSTYDVVLIASQAKDSFHDPRVCFTAQGWQLDQEHVVKIPTARGPFPVTLARITSDEGTRWAAFGYRTPYGFVGSTNQLKMQMFAYSLLHSKNSEGVFYRFIGISAGISQQSLVKFIQKYMNASGRFSHDYF